MPQELKEDTVELIRRIADQDREAFERFYDLYSPLAYTFALRILRTRAEAEDLVQEIFLQIWRQASAYNPKRGKPEAWVIMMTKSRAIDRVRSLRRKDRGMPALEENFQKRAGEAENRQAVDLEMKLTLQGALAGLSEIQKQALELAYFEGLTQTEIAGRLGIPVGTVKTRLRDGLLKLKGFLKSEPGEKIL